MITINSNTRHFNIPGSDLVFGVVADSDAERKYFQCPRYVGDNLDLAACFIRINYRNANGKEDFYLVDDMVIDGGNITFSWLLSPRVTEYRGQVKFVMCAVGPDLKLKWHTTQGTGQVMEGLEPDNSHVESQTADVVAQLISMVEAQTTAVENTGTEQIVAVKAAAKTAQDSVVSQIESKGVSTLATIPEDYTAVQSAVRTAANAFRGKVSGEVIRVDDVSPMEHYPAVKVHGKNLIPFPYTVSSVSVGSATISASNDGGVSVAGTPTEFTSLTLYNGAPLAKNGIVTFSISGTYANANAALVIQNANGVNIYEIELYATRSSIVINTDDYPHANKWIIAVKRGINGVAMSGTMYVQIEYGDTATEYVPYIDPTTVKVRACGKNLLTFPYFEGQQVTRGGITGTANADGSVRLVGTATENFYFRLAQIPLGSTTMIANKTDGVFYLQDCAYDAANKFSFCMVYKGETVDKTFYPQIEVGTVGTAYEPPLGTAFEVVPSADGAVSGLTAVSPTMSLLTNTPGVTIECEYSRDTNKVIAEIMEKIAAIGGI